jgi:hypothetical protein
MGTKRGEIGKNNSRALRNVGNPPQTLAPIVVVGLYSDLEEVIYGPTING